MAPSEFGGFPPNQSGAPIAGTRLESIEDLQKLLQQQDRRLPTMQEKPAQGNVVPFRPVRRPPMAMLRILDDGSDKGEWVRLREEKTVIGRVEGDIIIPHDPMMSSRHAEISRVLEQGYFRWWLSDLKSTNGIFVRVAGTVISHQQQILLGGRRFRFDAAVQGVSTPPPQPTPGSPAPRTMGWQAVQAAEIMPSLIEITPQGEGARIFLHPQDNWIGTDRTQCNVVLDNDLMLSPRHARLYRDQKGLWHLENGGSLNGTWLRVDRIPLSGTGMFQLGEQQFVFKIL